MTDEPRIVVVDDPDDEHLDGVRRTLREHNRAASPVFWEKLNDPANAPRPLHVFALASDGTAIGGLAGSTQFAWLKVDIMATRPEARGKGVGRALLARAEDVARERGCKHAYVDTMEHQAPAFYEKAGYRRAGRLDDWDSHGHAKFFWVWLL